VLVARMGEMRNGYKVLAAKHEAITLKT